MPPRRLVLARETLTPLHPDDLASVAGAGTQVDTVCAVASRLVWSYCADTTCGINCTAECHTHTCS
jgi:hypothetical protein